MTKRVDEAAEHVAPSGPDVVVVGAGNTDAAASPAFKHTLLA